MLVQFITSVVSAVGGVVLGAALPNQIKLGAGVVRASRSVAGLM